MEIISPLSSVQISDNPDNYNIQDELNAINEPNPSGVRVPGSKGYIQFHSGPCRWEKRWQALRKELSTYLGRTLFPVEVTKLMTEITRKIK